MNKKILIIRTDRIGDVILSTPLIKAIKGVFPDSFLAFMCQEKTSEILINNNYLDEIITYDKEKSMFFYVKLLKKLKFDIALLLLPTEKLAWILFFAGIKERITFGWKPYQALTFMKMVSRNKYIPLRHEADYCMDLARKIGVLNAELIPEINLTPSEIEKAKTLVNKSKNEFIIGINPFSGKSAPNWKIEKYIELTKDISDRYENIMIYFHVEGYNDIENFFDKSQKKKIVFLKNLPIREYILYISKFDVMISASTGPMHIAAALRVQTLSIFCPMTACSPKLWGPLGNVSKILLPPDDYCKSKCPGDPHICTFEGGIETNDIIKEIDKIFIIK